MKHIKLIFIDGAMFALMYLGLIKGNEYALNLFWPVFWVFALMSCLVMVLFLNEKTKKELIKSRKPNPLWKEKYSFTYDLLFSMSLAALGFHWSGAIWFILSMCTGSLIKEEDKKLREATKGNHNE